MEDRLAYLRKATIKSFDAPINTFPGMLLSEPPEWRWQGIGITISLLDKDEQEIIYDGYQSVRIPKGDDWWELKDDVFSNRNAITFPECTGGSCRAEFVRVWDPDVEIIITIPLDLPLVIDPGIMVEFAPGSLIVGVDHANIDVSLNFFN